MEIHTQWFPDKLAEKQLSQRGLAKLMGLDGSAVSLMLRGKREMRISEAAQIATFLGVPTEEVVARAGGMVREPSAAAASQPEVPIIGIVDGRGHVKWCEAGEAGSVPRPPGDLPPAVGAIQCRTAGTTLDYMDRWLLFVTVPSTEGVQPESIERLSVVKTRDGMTGIAQVRRGYTPGRWTLSGPAAAESEVDLEYAAPIHLITT